MLPIGSIQNSAERLSINRPQEVLQALYTFFQAKVLAKEDRKKIFLLVQDLQSEIALHAMEDDKLFPCLEMMQKVKKVIDQHLQEFSPKKQNAFVSIFSKKLLVDQKEISINPYQVAKKLPGIASLFVGNLAGNRIESQSLIENFEKIYNYMRYGVLPEGDLQLFALLKAADSTGYKALENVCAERILSGNEKSFKEELLTHALSSYNALLLIECLPYAIQSKTSLEVAELIKQAERFLPKDWIFKVKSLSLQGVLLDIQYEHKIITLKDFAAILTEIAKKVDPLCYSIKKSKEEGLKDSLELTVEKPPCSYSLLKAFSEIKGIKVFRIHITGDWNEYINLPSDFPHIKKLAIGVDPSSGNITKDVSYERLFPNVNRRSIYVIPTPL